MAKTLEDHTFPVVSLELFLYLLGKITLPFAHRNNLARAACSLCKEARLPSSLLIHSPGPHSAKIDNLARKLLARLLLKSHVNLPIRARAQLSRRDNVLTTECLSRISYTNPLEVRTGPGKESTHLHLDLLNHLDVLLFHAAIRAKYELTFRRQGQHVAIAQEKAPAPGHRIAVPRRAVHGRVLGIHQGGYVFGVFLVEDDAVDADVCVGDEGVVDGILAASWRWLVGSRLLGWEGKATISSCLGQRRSLRCCAV